MRIDHFLRASRLVVRRTLAQELCAAGAVLVNGIPAKSSRNVEVGDQITLRRWNDQTLTVRVSAIPSTRQISKHEASTLYETMAAK